MSQLKLFIESRHRVSGSSEDFAYQLPRGFDLPPSEAFLDDIAIPNVFYTITSRNNKLYLRELVSSFPVVVYSYRILTLDNGQYNAISLADEVTDKMNAGLANVIYKATYDTSTAKLSISTLAGEFAFFGEQALPGQWNTEQAANPISGDVNSANRVVGFYNMAVGTGVVGTALQAPDIVDLASHSRCLYIHSDLGLPEQSFGPRGDSGCVRKVLIDAPQNDLIIDRHTSTWGAINLDEQPLRSIRFSLRDDEGRLVDLQGHNWSFSLYISERV